MLLGFREKKLYIYRCIKCGKEHGSTNPKRIICGKCLKWNYPGAGQKELFKAENEAL